MENRKLIILPLVTLVTLMFLLNSCSKTDARKYPPDPKLRVKKNIEEGRGFRLMDMGKKKELVNLILRVRMSFGEHL